MTDFLDRSAKLHEARCELACDVLRYSGTLRLQVDGWSMLPSVWPGDILTVERVMGESVALGDIVLFVRERRLFAHRVIRTTGEPNLLTRGDAMRAADPLVRSEELLGRVSRIERNGRSFVPRRRIGVARRIVAAMVRRSSFAARVVVGVRSGFQSLQFRSRSTGSSRARACC